MVDVEWEDGSATGWNLWLEQSLRWGEIKIPKVTQRYSQRVYCVCFVTPASSNNIGLLGQIQNFKHSAVGSDQCFGKLGSKPSCSFVQFWLHTGQSAQYNQAAPEGLAKTLTLSFSNYLLANGSSPPTPLVQITIKHWQCVYITEQGGFLFNNVNTVTLCCSLSLTCSTHGCIKRTQPHTHQHCPIP